MDTNTQLDTNKLVLADRIGELLAESLLDEEIKQEILDNIGLLPETLLIRLLDSLEKESEKLEEVALEIQAFLKDQEKDWQNLENTQQNYTTQFMERALKNMEAEAEIEDIKGTL